MWCDTCEMRYCLHCGDAMGTLVRWHAGRTCAQFLQDADNAKAAAERKRLEKVANEGCGPSPCMHARRAQPRTAAHGRGQPSCTMCVSCSACVSQTATSRITLHDPDYTACHGVAGEPSTSSIQNYPMRQAQPRRKLAVEILHWDIARHRWAGMCREGAARQRSVFTACVCAGTNRTAGRRGSGARAAGTRRGRRRGSATASCARSTAAPTSASSAARTSRGLAISTTRPPAPATSRSGTNPLPTPLAGRRAAARGAARREQRRRSGREHHARGPPGWG